MNDVNNNSKKSKKKIIVNALLIVGVILVFLAIRYYAYYKNRPTPVGEPNYSIAYISNQSEHTVTITMSLGNSKTSVTISPDDTFEIEKEQKNIGIEEWLNSLDTVYLVFDGSISIPYYRISNNQYFPSEDNLLDKDKWILEKILVETKQNNRRDWIQHFLDFLWSESEYCNHYTFVINNETYSEAVDYNTNKKAR